MNDATTLNGAPTGAAIPGEAGLPALGLSETKARPGGWFTKLVRFYFKRSVARHKAAPAESAEDKPAPERALSAIRWACFKSAITGATAGAISTGATLFTAETEGLGGIVAAPVAAVTIGGEMIYRAAVHVDLTVALARIFEVEFDADNDDDLWRLYGLVFRTQHHDEESEDPGKGLVTEVSHIEGEQVGEMIGQRVLGESVMRNIVPFVGIVTSAVTNYTMTRRLGDAVRRYMRYQRAMDDAGALACKICNEHLDLLIEGIWFIFSADGKLEPEETAFLASMLQRLDPALRHAVLLRFGEDELDWTVRIKAEVPEAVRDTFLHTLEVAAAVDKEVGLPERKILRRAARALGREYSQERVEKMIALFEEDGVIHDLSRIHVRTGSPAKAPA